MCGTNCRFDRNVLSQEATSCMPHIRSLYRHICCTGTIPSSWAAAGAFPVMLVFQVTGAPIHGSLPASWGNNESFTTLNLLQVDGLSGTLPPEWGSPTAFQQLSVLSLSACNLTGTTAVLHTSFPCMLAAFATCSCCSCDTAQCN